MNKIKTNVQNIRKKASANIKQVAFESVFIALTLVIISILLFSNTIRVIMTGKSNYETFLKEKEALGVIEEKNATLSDDYEYVNSDEYKKILLRDSLGLADSNERLFRTREKSQYYDEEVVLLKLREKNSYEDWWMMLIN